jgi:hypothetical protein
MRNLGNNRDPFLSMMMVNTLHVEFLQLRVSVGHIASLFDYSSL